MNKALILVDFENERINSQSEYFVGDLSVPIYHTNQLIDYCRNLWYKIIFIVHIEAESTTAFAPNSESIQIIDQIHKNHQDTIVTKYKISPFFQTNLEQELEWIDEIIVWGILTNLCVRSLINDAYDRDFKITLIEDCCATFDEQIHRYTLLDLQQTRPEIQIKTTQNYIT